MISTEANRLPLRFKSTSTSAWTRELDSDGSVPEAAKLVLGRRRWVARAGKQARRPAKRRETLCRLAFGLAKLQRGHRQRGHVQEWYRSGTLPPLAKPLNLSRAKEAEQGHGALRCPSVNLSPCKST
jgi:hypothetical protein